jgi:ABC-type lipoprotein release transport system permease subunit
MKGRDNMKFIIRFAFRNIWRYKKRTIITFIAISVGIAAFVYVDSMLKGTFLASVRNFIDYESSHLKIYNKEFYKEMKDEDFLLLDKGIGDYENIEKLLGAEEIKLTPRITFNARLINEQDGGERPFTVIGINPNKDKNVYKLNETLLSGRFLEPGEYGIMIGRLGAKKMGVKLGDTLTILTMTKNDTYQTIMVEIVGILDPPNPNINRAIAYIPIDIADTDLSMEGSVTEIGIRAKNDNVDTELNRINGILQKNNLTQLEVISWSEMGKDWLTLNRTKKAGSYILILVVFIISAVGITNTMLMSVFERVREIGMMRALGMKDSEVLLSFIFEGIAIGLFGAILGLFIGFILNFHLIHYGINLKFAGDQDIGYRVMNVIKGVWNPESFAFAFIFSIMAPAIISIYPSWKAIKMEITKSLRS